MNLFVDSQFNNYDNNSRQSIITVLSTYMLKSHGDINTRDLRSFEIRFDFESNFRFGIRFVVMIRFKIFESSTPSIVLCKETIGGG